MRYLPHTEKTRKEMLEAIGVNHVDELYAQVPEEFLKTKNLHGLPLHESEMEVEQDMHKLADKNVSATKHPFFLGAGYYHHHIPATVDHLIQRGEFLTAYTPYQPEVSQGTLQAIFEFQSYICALTGQEIANASMYDGATATAEAALMAQRLNKKAKNIHVVDGLHPHYMETLDTYLNHSGGEILDAESLDENSAALIVQTPNFYGEVVDIEPYRKKCDETGAKLVVVVTEIVSLGMLPAPASADIVVGEGQSIGNPISFGGPSLGFFATKKEYLRQMPGRLCGETTDSDGQKGYVLTLNTREQHIRREKATSNICTNEGLCALAFTIHMSLLGEQGFKHLAKLNHAKACELTDKLQKINGVTVENKTFFNEFVIQLPFKSEKFVTDLSKNKIIAGLALDDNRLLVNATETTTSSDMDTLISAITEYPCD